MFIKVIRSKEGAILSVVIGMPDISKGIQACRGHVIPFGIFQIIRARKKSKQLNLLLGGIKEEYRGLGLDVIMGVKMLETSRKHGISYLDSHLELETNIKIRKEMERMGGVVYKRYRIFMKKL